MGNINNMVIFGKSYGNKNYIPNRYIYLNWKWHEIRKVFFYKKIFWNRMTAIFFFYKIILEDFYFKNFLKNNF